MLFNTVGFALFFIVVVALHYTIGRRSVQRQNILLLAASYFFYGCWDVRFLSLLIFSTALDYVTGLQLQKQRPPRIRKLLFLTSIGINLGVLCIFKYYNFFAASFTELVASGGWTVHPVLIRWVLPVGISFYTFHGLSYIIDLYKRRIDAECNWVDYALFVSFFPLLVAGPIERATHLLPQLKKKRRFSYPQAVAGSRLMLWGLFKKVVVADNCAPFVNHAFNGVGSHSGSTLLLGAIFFAVQIYGDFSGYSDMARGTARLLGIELLQNFRFPYFSTDIAQFWRRWHMSLSSWFRDYVYIPLGGNRGGGLQRIRNVLIVFLLSGFWHGANWTFIVWGGLHGLFTLPVLLTETPDGRLPERQMGLLGTRLLTLGKGVLTFSLVVVAWIFFRADTLSHACRYLSELVSAPFAPQSRNYGFSTIDVSVPTLLGLIGLLFGAETLYLLRQRWTLPERLFRNPLIRYGCYYGLVGLLVLFGGPRQVFLYFQF